MASSDFLKDWKELEKSCRKIDVLLYLLSEVPETSNDHFLAVVKHVPELHENLQDVPKLQRRFPLIESYVIRGKKLTDQKELVKWTFEFFDYLVSA
jgi:hypothetical protein